MKSRSVIILATLLLTSVFMPAQVTHHSGKLGVGIDGISTSPNFLFKYYLTDNFAMNYIAGLNLEFKGEDPPSGQTKVDGYDIRLGLAGLYHFNQNRVSPYVGIEAIYNIKQSAGFYEIEPDPKSILSTGLILGADYFLFDQFTLGLKQNLNFNFSLSRDIPAEETDVYINTTTQLTARYYFN